VDFKEVVAAIVFSKSWSYTKDHLSKALFVGVDTEIPENISRIMAEKKNERVIMKTYLSSYSNRMQVKSKETCFRN
jgi:hypothetical protein